MNASSNAGYDHVTPSRRWLVEKDFETRKNAISENTWINYPAADKVLAHIKYLTELPRSLESLCLVVHSDPGMGKSALYNKIMQQYGISSAHINALAGMRIDPDHIRSHKNFSDGLVQSLTMGNFTSSMIPKTRVLDAVTARNLRGIAFDEFNDLLAAGARDQLSNMIRLKYFSNPPFSLVIVILGTHECTEAIASDDQFKRRFESIQLPAWRDEQILRAFVGAYISWFPLRNPSTVDKPSAIKYLIKQSNGILDNIVKQLKRAAVWAIIEGVESIDLEILKKGTELPILDGR
ncbi:TniB family NTP-binding protein [Pseudomonas yamanorum]|uniref:TniB family NTP-binding protein n=1 Tax=Pseudomonas yamanorum TaxID=515393 RepID=UPI001C450F6F|nr:TniB family NTP-binding protein [Pseudomonas yamanorum]MBV6659807.1 TniB family NTP-binding protein [Pseudomonas yamanorum]